MLSRDEFEQLLEYIKPSEWAVRLEWVLQRVSQPAELNDKCELLQAALDVLAYPAFRASHPSLLISMLAIAHTAELLKYGAIRDCFRARLPWVTEGFKGVNGGMVRDPYRAVWIQFFSLSWQAGAPLDAESDLTAALLIGEKNPLSKADVAALGASGVDAMKLLVSLAPGHAIPLYGYRILSEEPSFAQSFSEDDLLQIDELAPSGLRDDKHWAACREVIGQVSPPAALRMAISLVKQSREMSDLHLVAGAYRAVDGFTRKQVWLPTELGSLWKLAVREPGREKEKRTFGDEILKLVGDAAAPDATTMGIVEGAVAPVADGEASGEAGGRSGGSKGGGRGGGSKGGGRGGGSK